MVNHLQQASKDHRTNDNSSDESSTIIGIDLGTTYSVVAVWRVVNGTGSPEVLSNSEGKKLTPSFVSFGQNGINDYIVGDEAVEQRVSNPTNTIFDMKRLTGRIFRDEKVQMMIANDWPFKVLEGDNQKPLIELQFDGGTKCKIQPIDVQACILKKMKETAELRLGKTVNKAVISVPAYFGRLATSETEEAARRAGLQVEELIKEPTAAAYFYGFNKFECNEYNLFAFDLGGGTFDCTIVRVENRIFFEKRIDGDEQLGGRDFDRAMFGLVSKKIFDKYGRNVMRDEGPMLLNECEICKKRLSSHTQAQIRLGDVFEDIKDILVIQRSEYEEWPECKRMVENAMAKVRKLLEDSKLKPTDINDVLLVGGSTRLPMIEDALQREFSHTALKKSVNVDEAVAVGAAIRAGQLCNAVKYAIPYMLSIIRVTPMSLGASGQDGLCYKLIERCSNVPCSSFMIFERHFATRPVTVYVKIYEGERLLESGNNILDVVCLENLRPDPDGTIRSRLRMDLDKNGLLTVVYENAYNGKFKAVSMRYGERQIDDQRVQKMLEQAEKAQTQDKTKYDRYKAKQALEQAIAEVEYRYRLEIGAKAKERQKQCQKYRKWLHENETTALRTKIMAKLSAFRRDTDDYNYTANASYETDSSEESDEQSEFSDEIVSEDDDDDDSAPLQKRKFLGIGLDATRRS